MYASACEQRCSGGASHACLHAAGFMLGLPSDYTSGVRVASASPKGASMTSSPAQAPAELSKRAAASPGYQRAPSP